LSSIPAPDHREFPIESLLADLHWLFRIAFGWTDFHLHRFRIRKTDGQTAADAVEPAWSAPSGGIIRSEAARYGLVGDPG
jgi:hypothetical protein